ncbi:MAG: type II secretion system protein GspC [Nitrospirota bacterium]
MYRKYLFVIINLAIITIGIYIVADMINILAGYAFEVSSNNRSLKKRVSLPSDKKRADKIDIQSIIIRGNIFNSKARDGTEEPVLDEPHPVQPTSIGEESPQLPLSDLKVKLIGTIVGKGKYSYAVIEDRRKRRQTLYRLNDLIADDAKIAMIERNKITLLRRGREEILKMYDKGEKGHPSKKKKKSPAPASGIRSVGQNNWVLDRGEVDAALDNLPQLLTKARIVPNFQGGKPNGFKIFSIVPKSFYDKIGLKNGDIIQRINEIEIKKPDNFLKVFLQLKDEDNFTLDMIRSNRKETFEYEIR